MEVGGQVIHPADVIVADNDGVIVIRPAELEEVLTRAEAIKDWEQRAHQFIINGGNHQDMIGQVGPMP